MYVYNYVDHINVNPFMSNMEIIHVSTDHHFSSIGLSYGIFKSAKKLILIYIIHVYTFI
jgi:hypothetical protein